MRGALFLALGRALWAVKALVLARFVRLAWIGESVGHLLGSRVDLPTDATC